MAGEQYEIYESGTAAALAEWQLAALAGKADPTALAPLLTAGAALGITGEATDSAAWLQRVSASDGPTTVKSIHGRTLRWNQLCDRAWTGSTKARVTTSDSDGTMTVTTTSDSSLKFVDFIVTAGHTYLIKADYTTSGEAVAYGTYDANNNYDKRVYLSGEVSTVQHVADLLTTTSTYNHVRVVNFGTSAASGASCTVKNLMLFDLTVMFGSGNEPTVAEFEAMYPADYYPYDAGSLLPVNMTGIATEDANGDPLQTRTIPAGTLRGAGTTYDELTETERITRMGMVDLGTLDWATLSTPTNHIFRVDTGSITNIQTASGAVPADALIVGYQVVAYDPMSSSDDKCFAISGSSVHRLVIVDHAYSDAAAFKAAMDGVYLLYPLATPTTQTIDPPLNLTYRTEQGGIERVMVPTGENSAPPTIVAAQGYTAESLRDAALSAIAPVENGKASTNYGVGSYLIHGGQLCRVTTAIATGEAITIGTNVTTTTVMAEVIALIAQ